MTEYTINSTLHAVRKKTIDPAQFIQETEEYIHYYNHQLIIVKLKGMSPVDFRVHAL
ncbi:IS3 family transposase [Peribacillus frigoritolerans]